MSSPGRTTVGGRDLKCQHCGHEEFYHRTTRLAEVALGRLLHFEGIWGQHTDIFVCASCGFAHLFLPVPDRRVERVATEPPPEEECLSCGKPIPGDAAKCPACGWTWSADTNQGG
jgi:DNA-directed RNA polymerase subunit RPC12/RpoP